MDKPITNTDRSKDYYKAVLENNSLVMTPFCSCGNCLKEDYFCEKCNKQCRCFNIICDTESTLQIVKKHIRNSPKFAGHRAYLSVSEKN